MKPTTTKTATVKEADPVEVLAKMQADLDAAATEVEKLQERLAIADAKAASDDLPLSECLEAAEEARKLKAQIESAEARLERTRTHNAARTEPLIAAATRQIRSDCIERFSDKAAAADKLIVEAAAVLLDRIADRREVTKAARAHFMSAVPRVTGRTIPLNTGVPDKSANEGMIVEALQQAIPFFEHQS